MNIHRDSDVLGVLLDIAENDPPLARRLSLVEPTKLIYRLLEKTNDPTKKLALELGGSGLAQSRRLANLCLDVSLFILSGRFQRCKSTSKEESLTMQQHLYPTDWKARAAACLARAGYRCENCGIPHGVLRVGKRSKSPYVVYLHAAHVNHDPENQEAELKALCPACHMKHDRRTERKGPTARRQGYQVVSTGRLLVEMHSAGLRITQEGDRFYWQVGDLSGLANDLLDAIGSALHCLRMDRLEMEA
jgi:5-methylcytosine-specific restriction endonuclease McrA